MAFDQVLNINEFIEKRKKKTFKVMFNDIEILLLHDAPFVDVNEAENDDKQLKDMYFENFRSVTVPEDLDKWDAIEDDPDVGVTTAAYIYEYIKTAVGDRKKETKELEDRKSKK